jgi:hypothetical protein
LSFLVAARGASAFCGGFGFALNSAAAFHVFCWSQVTNYGVLYVPFDSAPNGSNYIYVWDLCLHAQTASPLFRRNVLAITPGESKPKNCLIARVTSREQTHDNLLNFRARVAAV